jgi:hypothetical protein
MVKQLLNNRNTHTLLKSMIPERLSERVCPNLVFDTQSPRGCIDDGISLPPL